jgi:hypothetical protein
MPKTKHVKTPENVERLKELVMAGASYAMMAQSLGIAESTLYNKYQKDINAFRVLQNARVGNSLFKNATENMNVRAQELWMRWYAGMQDKTAVDVTTNGESMNMNDQAKLILSVMTSEQLEAVKKQLELAPADYTDVSE